MPTPKGYDRFTESGWPSVCKTAVDDSGNMVILPPGAGKHIHLLGVCCNSDTKVRRLLVDGNGAPLADGSQNGVLELLFQESQSMTNFPGAVALPEDTGAYFQTNDNVTAFYYIYDSASN